VKIFPGPGAYNLPPKYKDPKFAMGIKFNDLEDERLKTPGPGQYDGNGNMIR
jgi:hypothetical protein